MTYFVVDFQIIRPKYEISQENILEWIAAAHTRAEAGQSHWDPEGQELQKFYREIKERLFKVGVGTDKVQSRGSALSDIVHLNWEKMQIYQISCKPKGFGFKERSAFFDRTVTEIFEQFYPEDKSVPEHLIHVTCTGYISPSGAQKLVSKRNLVQTTGVTHAYHMGCYASIPALRIATGHLATTSSPMVDIIHTELCGLHMNPLLHHTEQLIVHSLFGDGFIKYSAVKEIAKEARGFKILTLHEEMIPNSIDSMSWLCEDWGMKMTIAKEVPVLIGKALEGFVTRLSKRASLDPERIFKTALFAIHPGGPKIIEQVGSFLKLSPLQIEKSRQVLQNYGNMSSATLPHVWDLILKDLHVKSETLVVSLAFGPGMNIAGALFETL